jgi:tyrosine-protein kinase Etk/Wzc
LRLFRETKYQDNIYQLYCKLAELARLDAARNVSTVLFVDRATPPEKKSKPKRLLMALIIGFVTFFCMTFYAFLLEFWRHSSTQDNQIRYLEELRFYLRPWREGPKRFWAKMKWFK